MPFIRHIVHSTFLKPIKNKKYAIWKAQNFECTILKVSSLCSMAPDPIDSFGLYVYEYLNYLLPQGQALKSMFLTINRPWWSTETIYFLCTGCTLVVWNRIGGVEKLVWVPQTPKDTLPRDCAYLAPDLVYPSIWVMLCHVEGSAGA